MQVYGLLITKDDHEAFGDWCRDQLSFYEAVVCLDGSESDETARQAQEFSSRLTYLHERDFKIPAKTDHGLRRIVHQELVKRHGPQIWIMCCHTDEFCYHDPRKIADRAAAEGYDQVSWYSPHFYPHPDELPDLANRLKRPLLDRFHFYHWSHHGNEQPWIEDRLYRAGPHVWWDASTHGSVRPHGLRHSAPYHPIFRHFKVASVDLQTLELDGHATRYRGHWQNLEHRTGMAFRVERMEDLFVKSVPNYSRCDRFEGDFVQAWNMGEEFRPDRDLEALMAAPGAASAELPSTSPKASAAASARPVMAIGPRMPGFGSWEWVGEEMAEELSAAFDVKIFEDEIPECDLVVFVKFKPSIDVLKSLSQTAALIYCPIDAYGSCREIDADASSLMKFSRILIHCERLRRHFNAYAPVTYVDHHVKFAAPLREEFCTEGPLLWVGVRSNLAPLVEWVNSQQLPEELWVLTNPEDPRSAPSAAEFGFGLRNRVRVECWNSDTQRDWTKYCRFAVDVKGEDFRSRNKPPAKGIDYLASGVPLMLQPEGSTAEHLQRLGFNVAALGDWDRLGSRQYWEETVKFGRQLGTELTRARVGNRWQQILSETLKVWREKQAAAVPRLPPTVVNHVSTSSNSPVGIAREIHAMRLPTGSVEVPVWVRGQADREMVQNVFQGDNYGVLQWQLPPASVVVDVGAQIGAFTLLACHLWHQARVIALETDPGNSDLLRRNLEGHPQVEIVGSLSALWIENRFERCDLLKVSCQEVLSLFQRLASEGLLERMQYITGEWHAENAAPAAATRARARLAQILAATHQVEFAPGTGKQGHFRATRLWTFQSR